MSTARESAIVRAILTYLKTRPEIWAMKVHGSPMQVAGIPDIVGVFGPAGRAFALEVKRPGEAPTVLQERIMERLRAAGVLVAVVHSVDEVREVLP